MNHTSSFRLAQIALASGLAIGGLTAAKAADVAVKLSGDQEVPAVASAATGVGAIVIKNDKSVSGSIKLPASSAPSRIFIWANRERTVRR